MVGRREPVYSLSRFARFRSQAIPLGDGIPTALPAAEEHVLRLKSQSRVPGVVRFFHGAARLDMMRAPSRRGASLHLP